MIDRLFSLLAPHICSNCRKVGSVLCESCAYDIVEERFQCCVMCLTPTLRSNLCQGCQSTSPLEDAYVVSWRRGAVKNLLNAYKFEYRREAAEPLARLLAVTLPVLPQDTAIIPIPTLRAHVRERSFDHTRDIAQRLARRRNYTVRPLLIRVSTAVQHGATKKKRNEQAKTMFHVAPKPLDAPILLLDDIYTTGSTVREAAKLLRTVTDQPIYLAIIARQPIDEDNT